MPSRPLAASISSIAVVTAVDRDIKRPVTNEFSTNVDRRRHGGGQGNEVLGLHPARDAVNLGLGVVDEVDDFTLAGVTHLHDARAGLDQSSQDCLFGHNAGVEPGIRCCGNQPGQRVQVLRTAGPGDLPALGEFVGNSDDVGRLAVGVQRKDRVEDDLVLGNVEVGAAHALHDIGDGILAQHHPADGALFRQ